MKNSQSFLTKNSSFVYSIFIFLVLFFVISFVCSFHLRVLMGYCVCTVHAQVYITHTQIYHISHKFHSIGWIIQLIHIGDKFFAIMNEDDLNAWHIWLGAIGWIKHKNEIPILWKTFLEILNCIINIKDPLKMARSFSSAVIFIQINCNSIYRKILIVFILLQRFRDK